MRLALLLLPLLFVFATLPVIADEPEAPASTELESPADAWVTFNNKVRELPRAQQRSARAKLAAEYLDSWALSGREAKGIDMLYLGQFDVAAGRAGDAWICFRSVIEQEGLEPTDRARAGQAIAGLLANATHCDELDGKDCVDDAVSLLMTWLGEDPAEGTEPLCAAAHMSLGGFYSRAKDVDKATEHYLAGAVLNPNNAYTAGRSISRGLMSSTHAMDGYPKVLKEAKHVQTELVGLAKESLTNAKAALAAVEADAAASDREKTMAQRRVDSASRSVERLEGMLVPFEMLGKDVPTWTLEHAYSDVKQITDLRGKVVLIDFWATWCGWCIKSMPALRDLLRDYEGKDFAIVGVTASASTVYDARYDLDDDMTEKKTDGWRPKAACRIARGSQAPDPENGIFASGDEAFHAAEKDAIQRFIDNHEMTWPVVMIDKDEPSAKYALTGWPHAVVLDRQGRVRYFKVGALLRDRPEQVKAFKKVIDDLLAEPGEG